MATGPSGIKVYLSVCDDAKAVNIAGKTYNAGTQGEEIAAKLHIDGDRLKISIPGYDVQPKVGGASKIQAISLRMCGERASIIAIYSDPMMNTKGCCACCVKDGVQWCVYGDSGCVCC
jgi:hypothetical protein